MRIFAMMIIFCFLFCVGCGNEESDYDAGIEAYKRGHYAVALSNFESRAMKGDPVAQFCLGYMYKHEQIPIPKELREKTLVWYTNQATKWYTKAAEQNYGPAQNNLALMYYLLVERKELSKVHSDTLLNEARKWFQKAAEEHKNPVAQYNFGLLSIDLAIINEAKAELRSKFIEDLEERQQRIEDLDPKVQESLRRNAKAHEEAAKWYIESVNWFTKAANNDYYLAQFELANMFYFNMGVDKNLSKTERWEKAQDWYTKAGNYAPAQYKLSSMYVEGKGVDKNLEEAVKLLREAAAKNHAPAQFALGRMYIYGHGVEKDTNEAIKLWTKAANKGDAFSQFYLGLMYDEDLEFTKDAEKAGPKDAEKAVRYYFAAAQQGRPHAQVMVGVNFEDGVLGVPQDNLEAYYWYSLALKEREKLEQEIPNLYWADNADEGRERVGSKLTQEEKERVKERVNNWKPKDLVGSGTGFYIDEKHILTNAHVVTDDNKHKYDELRIGYRYVEEKPEEPGTKPIDHDVDLALLLDPSGNKNNYAKFRSRLVDVEENIALFGYPLSFDLSYEGNITLGIVSALLGPISSHDPRRLTSYNPRTLFQHTAPQQPGNSGGPVFDSDGNVIGVSVSGIDPFLYREGGITKVSGVDNISFAIKFDIIKKFLEEDNNIKIITANPKTTETKYVDKDDREKIITNAKKFTYPVLCFKNKEPEPLPLKEITIVELGR